MALYGEFGVSGGASSSILRGVRSSSEFSEMVCVISRLELKLENASSRGRRSGEERRGEQKRGLDGLAGVMYK